MAAQRSMSQRSPPYSWMQLTNSTYSNEPVNIAESRTETGEDSVGNYTLRDARSHSVNSVSPLIDSNPAWGCPTVSSPARTTNCTEEHPSSDSTLGLQKSIPYEDDNKSLSALPNLPPVRHQSRDKLKVHISRYGWWWEVSSILVALLCTTAIITILTFVDQKPIASWRLPIQPNSLVSIFSTIAKSALLVSVAECLGQLKWDHFGKPEPLSDIQVFDGASRGPWGALVFLGKMRTGASLGSIGAFITLVLLTFEPFTQQVIQFGTRNAMLANETGFVSYSHSLNGDQLLSFGGKKDGKSAHVLTFLTSTDDNIPVRSSRYFSS